MTISNVRSTRLHHSLASAATIAAVFAGAALVTAASKPTAEDPKVGTDITITGCLHAGDFPDTFVISNVVERPAVGAPVPRFAVPVAAIYWLDSTDGMKPLVGQRIDITGRVTKRRESPGKITIELRPGSGEKETVKVESNNAVVKSEKFKGTARPIAPSGDKTTTERLRPVYKLDVKSVSAAPRVGELGPACS